MAGQRRRPQRPDEVVANPTSDADTSEELVTEDLVDDSVEASHEDSSDDSAGETLAAEDISPETSDEDESPEVVDDEDSSAGAVTRRFPVLPAVAFAIALALLAAVLLVTRADPEARSRDASAAAATARSTLEQILSYNHSTMTQQIPANQALLTGTFKSEFGQTMTKTIVPMAQKDKTVVKARAYEVGVMSQTDDTVTVQAFVNQARTSDAQKEPSIDQNRVIATMQRVGDRWLISTLKAY
ncbi:hypothetical protein N803_04255 [Knoellia subterranea KCTC 19937]|uniref:Mce-associated membrane protein n=1 Tax=Knoellia subterranea KCTC 19937 TaxID=1385521 RepID=A0A0A0JKG9_9MICO|nr:hypothetical protein N803_04255 [Knoellia subterranea KCTC 19937]